jgi:ABC-type hemin transport system substrate-binding protein
VATSGINQTISDIANVIQTTNQIDQYAKAFDQVLAAAAKVLAAVG